MRKDPTLASLLNLFLLGTGHMYLGQIAKGVLILAVGVALGMIVWEEWGPPQQNRQLNNTTGKSGEKIL